MAAKERASYGGGAADMAQLDSRYIRGLSQVDGSI
jgi:hypothetical protein